MGSVQVSQQQASKPEYREREESLIRYNIIPEPTNEPYIIRNVDQAQLEYFTSIKFGDPLLSTLQAYVDQNQTFMILSSGQDSSISITKYFREQKDLQIFLSNAIKLTIMLNISIYQSMKIDTIFDPCECVMFKSIKNMEKLTKDYFLINPQKKIDLLLFLSRIFSQVKNIYLQPEFIVESDSQFHLLNFETKDISNEEMLFSFIIWLYGEKYDRFNDINVDCQIEHSIPTYLRQICHRIASAKYRVGKGIVVEMTRIKERMQYLNQRPDSFYACLYYRRVGHFVKPKDWIFYKKRNQLYFYHISDEHCCHVKLIRKKKKIDVDDSHLIFDPEDLEVLYVPQNAKFIVKANQFQMELPTTMSDIQIKYKIPIKCKNALLSRLGDGDILLFDQMLYRYSPPTNKLIQLTKKVSDVVCITENKENTYLIIKSSVDIFKNGLRVYYKDEDFIISPTGNKSLLEELSNIRVDIRSVNFCLEVYKGVFLMMAANNLWIIDINFQCFFSFGLYSRIKQVYGFSKNSKKVDYVFDILDQPFKVEFPSQQNGQNLCLHDNYLHILGQIGGRPYHLKYKFIPRLGAIELKGYKPLFVDQKNTIIKKKEINITEAKEYKFNFHEQNSSIYKYGKWIFNGPLLLKLYDFSIRWEKTTYEATLQIQPVRKSLKEKIELLKSEGSFFSRVQVLMLLYKMFIIQEYLVKNSINHRNFSVGNIYFTRNHQIKLTGWSQPARNWHVSDFKDYLLTCFNIITLNTIQKISQKNLKKHQNQLSQYLGVNDKIQTCLKNTKTVEKKVEIEKHLLSIKQYLQKQLCGEFHHIKEKSFIFSFEFNTPRFNMMNIHTQKIKKMQIIVQDSMAEQFLFHLTDKYEWNEKEGYLYIFTASYQFYEVKINTEDMGEEKLTLEDYEYLPKNITDSVFIFHEQFGLYSFGGVKKQNNGNPVFSKEVYKFNRKILTWEPIGTMPQARINPKAVISADGKKIYLFGGLIDHEFPYFKTICFDLRTNEFQLLVDKSIENPTLYLDQKSFYTVYHVSDKLHLFLMLYLQDGSYCIRYFSCLESGFDVEIQAKNFSTDNQLSKCSITLEDNVIHVLRPYGKYTRISIHKLQSAAVKTETIYSL